MRYINLLFHFFCQAEDGIRDYKVTGVQTCALPISSPWAKLHDRANVRPIKPVNHLSRQVGGTCGNCPNSSRLPHRSEERRVGKECRPWGWWSCKSTEISFGLFELILIDLS